MFIDERTRFVQKIILDELYNLTGNNAGQFHSKEVLMFRDNCERAELSNTFYCRELKLASWCGSGVSRISAVFPSQSDRETLWQVVASRCELPEKTPPPEWTSAATIADLIVSLVPSVDSSAN